MAVRSDNFLTFGSKSKEIKDVISIQQDKVLIVDFVSTGHHAEYILHLIRYGNSHKISFLLADSFKDKLNASLLDPFEVYYIDKDKSAAIANITSRRKRTRALWELVDAFQRQTPFSQVFFMYLNHMLKPWRVLDVFRKKRYAYSGILFQPPFLLKKLKGRANEVLLRRELALLILMADRNCQRILLLNDLEGAQYYAKLSKKIGFIPDPVNLVPSSALDIRAFHKIPADNQVLLHIGVIGEHKGTFELLSAYEKLAEQNDQRTTLLIVGKAKEEARLDREIDRLNRIFEKQKSISSVVLRNEFVADADFSAYMEQCDAVLIANKNTEASSGIVNHVLRWGKRVVAPKAGYFEQALEAYPRAILYDQDLALHHALAKLLKDRELDADNSFIPPTADMSKAFAEIILSDVGDRLTS